MLGWWIDVWKCQACRQLPSHLNSNTFPQVSHTAWPIATICVVRNLWHSTASVLKAKTSSTKPRYRKEYSNHWFMMETGMSRAHYSKREIFWIDYWHLQIFQNSTDLVFAVWERIQGTWYASYSIKIEKTKYLIRYINYCGCRYLFWGFLWMILSNMSTSFTVDAWSLIMFRLLIKIF